VGDAEPPDFLERPAMLGAHALAAKAFAAMTSAAGVLRLWRRVCAEKHGFGDDQVAARARRDRVAASGWESQWR
jgi:hypothetical protein